MELFRLFGSVIIDDQDAIDKLKSVDQKGKDTESTLSKMAGGAVKVGAAVGGMAIAGGAALLGVATKAAETTDRIDKLSLKTQLSRQGFQEWDHVMTQSGMSIESLQGGMKKLVNSVDDALQGNNTYIESFGRLGISVDELQGKSPEQVFEMTVAALQEMPQSAEKAALANELLGRAASEMAPILDMSAEATNALKQEAHDLGLVMSDEAVDAGVVFSDTLANVKNSFGMLVSNIGVQVMPIIQKFLDWVIANMPTIKRVMQVVFTAISAFVSTAVDIFQNYLLPVISAVVGWVQANWPTISAVIGTVFGIVKDIIRTAVDTIKGIIGGFQWVVDKVTSIFNTVRDAIKNPLETAKGIVRGIIDTIKGFFKFNISWPKIPMPHFGISPAGWKIGDLLKGSIPRLGISWYAEGGIFDQPTLFNTPYGLKGVGEAGPEVVAPLSKLQQMIDFNSNRDLLEKQNDLLSRLLDKDTNLYLDGEKITETIHEPIDERSGFKNRERELAYGGI